MLRASESFVRDPGNAERNVVYVPVSDRLTAHDGARQPQPGLHALDLDTGAVIWSTVHQEGCVDPTRCDSGVSAAVTATPDLVIAGALDGLLRAYDAVTGAVLWSYQTAGEQRATNGEVISGGAIDVHGPTVAGDMVFVTSGYGAFLQRSGNAFLAFTIDDGGSNE